jgi:hypothetical protein
VAEGRVPLLMTRSLLFAGAGAFEGAVTAFAGGDGLARIRLAAAENHALGQKRPVERVRGAFTNPSHARWRLEAVTPPSSRPRPPAGSQPATR